MVLRACLPTFIVCLIAVAARAAADPLPSGLYELIEGATGREVPRADGPEGTVRLGDRLTDRLGTGTLVSRTNANDSFVLRFDAAGPVPGNTGTKRLAVVVAGKCFPTGSNSDRRADGTMELGATVAGESLAEAVAAELGSELRLRRHPGHRLAVSVAPEKKSYRVGEPVTLVLSIRNVGDKPISFDDGGSQRGPRNNQFAFTAFRNSGYGKALLDVGDPMHHGGMVARPTVKPGETFTKKVELDRWFRFDAPETYKVTAIYALPIAEPDFDVRPIWDDFTSRSDTTLPLRLNTPHAQPIARPRRRRRSGDPPFDVIGRAWRSGTRRRRTPGRLAAGERLQRALRFEPCAAPPQPIRQAADRPRRPAGLAARDA
jgi:hypothetical protein